MEPRRDERQTDTRDWGSASLPALLDSSSELKFVEHCGVCAVVNSQDAVSLTFLGLSHLQHRGQDGGGIAALARHGIDVRRGMGKIREILTPEVLQSFSRTTAAIGHTRYGTTGGQELANVQPFTLEIPGLGDVAIAHNGNLTNASLIRARLEADGCIFKSSSDTEVILHLISQAAPFISDKAELLSYALRQVTGSYSINPSQLIFDNNHSH